VRSCRLGEALDGLSWQMNRPFARLCYQGVPLHRQTREMS
jgi:hypothetical protein